MCVMIVKWLVVPIVGAAASALIEYGLKPWLQKKKETPAESLKTEENKEKEV